MTGFIILLSVKVGKKVEKCLMISASFHGWFFAFSQQLVCSDSAKVFH
jgi:hypothetical protein